MIKKIAVYLDVMNISGRPLPDVFRDKITGGTIAQIREQIANEIENLEDNCEVDSIDNEEIQKVLINEDKYIRYEGSDVITFKVTDGSGEYTIRMAVETIDTDKLWTIGIRNNNEYVKALHDVELGDRDLGYVRTYGDIN